MGVKCGTRRDRWNPLTKSVNAAELSTGRSNGRQTSAPTTSLSSALLLAALYITYLTYTRKRQNTHQHRRSPQTHRHKKTPHRTRTILTWLAAITAGTTALYFTGETLSTSIETLGTTLGVPLVILGAIIAVATSLPEATTFTTSYNNTPPGKKQKQPTK